MKQPFFLLTILLTGITAKAQFIRYAPAGDTTRTITLEGYADVYFAFDFNEPREGGRPYFVSHARHKEINLNLAYLSIQYSSQRARATFPGALNFERRLWFRVNRSEIGSTSSCFR